MATNKLELQERIVPLVGIQSDENTTLVFEEFHMAAREGGLRKSLALAIADGNDYGKLFSFDSPHEALAFFRRCVEQCERRAE